ncbi:hypothetical protein GCM10012280_26530 [Wenjunlia tyrosinilytica]|uniref:Uncharacterized protein n=1 Tax=Wenjunlia tyrosinilytica TaxID=1544741 RepID=A0A917ZN01_9ACTN|nr:hypothetical protein GCM10012280_26530 [Wenjunlia tyrosinilytica]
MVPGSCVHRAPTLRASCGDRARIVRRPCVARAHVVLGSGWPGRVGMGRAGLGRAGLGWAGMGWDGPADLAEELADAGREHLGDLQATKWPAGSLYDADPRELGDRAARAAAALESGAAGRP